MRWFRSQLEGAGLARLGPLPPTVILIVAAITVAMVLQSSFKVIALSVFGAIGFLAMLLELISAKSKRRRREFSLLWPEVLDSLQSGVASGLTLVESFADLARRGPLRFRAIFGFVANEIDRGLAMTEALDLLKSSIGEVHADTTCEVLRLTSITGAERLGAVLKSEALQLREELHAINLIESKQGWVASTAKLAVIAPWVIVALLSIRQENALIYNSTTGVTILLIGFIVSVFAYRLVHVLGNLPSQPRIWQP